MSTRQKQNKHESLIKYFGLLLIEGILCLAFIFVGETSILAAEKIEKEVQNWWLEIGGDFGYQRTDSWFKDQRDFGKSILSPKGGYRFYIRDFLFFDPYVKAEALADLGSREQNKFFWNNNVKYGSGARLRAEHKKPKEEEHGFRLNYANLDYYAEYLLIYFIDRGKDIPDNIPKNDFRTGLNSWLSMDSEYKLSHKSNFKKGVWFEMWSDLTYSRTLFYIEGKHNFCILTLSPKVGLRLGYKAIALEPYYRLDYVRDLYNEDWNKEAWSNNTKYGPGIRLSLGGLTKPKGTSIYLYAEYLNIDYHSRVGWKADGLSNYDVRAGINLWIPFGASKGTPGRTH